jgi:hypothetical protein
VFCRVCRVTAHVFCHVLSRLSRDCACVLSCVVAFVA